MQKITGSSIGPKGPPGSDGLGRCRIDRDNAIPERLTAITEFSGVRFRTGEAPVALRRKIPRDTQRTHGKIPELAFPFASSLLGRCRALRFPVHALPYLSLQRLRLR